MFTDTRLLQPIWEENSMKIQKSGEDYLEAILVLGESTGGEVRSVDVSRSLGVTRPSVSRAMKLLSEGGFIIMHPTGRLELTPEGLDIASRIYERHRVLSAWLESIGVSPDVAAEDACRIEHDLSPETFEHIKAFINRS